MREICWITGLWNFVRRGVAISGHDYVETMDERCDHLRVQILTCQRCGYPSVGWEKF